MSLIPFRFSNVNDEDVATAGALRELCPPRDGVMSINVKLDNLSKQDLIHSTIFIIDVTVKAINFVHFVVIFCLLFIFIYIFFSLLFACKAACKVQMQINAIYIAEVPEMNNPSNNLEICSTTYSTVVV